MEFRREGPVAGPVVRGFSGHGFRVGETLFAQGVMLDPERAVEWAAPDGVARLVPAMIEGLLALDPLPEFLLLGTGASLEQPPRAFVAAVEARGIGVEAMDSRAAARAWGVLRQEERWIVAALMPLG
ncbi:MTH938/NDUFAF3 family protein [Sphingobium sufflavum]|uniref:MTH938/NDUFAF3 family protein n=1 Tax=Sphingobium sufflavum TaxID=1129547 RepID=UPI001F1CE4DE|nr:MTH938/NDUFAF3 family protein [Sphingobium sufflavum]MCE7798443.1 MTH938/NDUFAF3 family protein [Sphingobium sufflavum]